MTRRVPARAAAASRLSVPRVRSSLVTANALSRLRRLRSPATAVIWCTITSGAAAATAAGSAPAARTRATLPAALVAAVTSWPAATRPGTRNRPSAPVAPMTNTRITFPSPWCFPCHQVRYERCLGWASPKGAGWVESCGGGGKHQSASGPAVPRQPAPHPRWVGAQCRSRLTGPGVSRLVSPQLCRFGRYRGHWLLGADEVSAPHADHCRKRHRWRWRQMMYWNARRAQARVLGGAGTGNGPAGLGGPALLVSAVFIAQFDLFVVNVAAPVARAGPPRGTRFAGVGHRRLRIRVCGRADHRRAAGRPVRVPAGAGAGNDGIRGHVAAVRPGL